jgi:hypothetical protein
MAQASTSNKSDRFARARIAEEVTGVLPIRAKMSLAARLTGIGRTRLFELKTLGKIKCKHVKFAGAQRGVILVHIPTLLQYIEEMGD